MKKEKKQGAQAVEPNTQPQTAPKENTTRKQEQDVVKDVNKGDESGTQQIIASFKRQLAGYKGANDTYKKKNDALVKEVEELSEKIKDKERKLEELYARVHELEKALKDKTKEANLLESSRDAWKENYLYVCNLPWYKRIFYKEK